MYIYFFFSVYNFLMNDTTWFISTDATIKNIREPKFILLLTHFTFGDVIVKENIFRIIIFCSRVFAPIFNGFCDICFARLLSHDVHRIIIRLR